MGGAGGPSCGREAGGAGPAYAGHNEHRGCVAERGRAQHRHLGAACDGPRSQGCVHASNSRPHCCGLSCLARPFSALQSFLVYCCLPLPAAVTFEVELRHLLAAGVAAASSSTLLPSTCVRLPHVPLSALIFLPCPQTDASRRGVTGGAPTRRTTSRETPFGGVSWHCCFSCSLLPGGAIGTATTTADTPEPTPTVSFRFVDHS